MECYGRCAFDPLTIATIATVAGTAVSAVGTIAAGKQQQGIANYQAQAAEQEGIARQREAEFAAKQLDIQATDEQAAGQREAEQYRRQKQLALSTAQNRAAASGFSATDPSTLQIGDDIAEYGTLQEQMAAFGGASRRAGTEAQAGATRATGNSAYASSLMEAQASRMSGKAARTASYFNAGSTILGGISTMADRYGGKSKTPKTSSYRYG